MNTTPSPDLPGKGPERPDPLSPEAPPKPSHPPTGALPLAGKQAPAEDGGTSGLAGNASRLARSAVARLKSLRATQQGKIALVAAAAVVLGLLAWAIAAGVGGNTEAQGPGQETEASQYQIGQCFAGFDATAASNRVVDCAEPHSAQLVAVHSYPAEQEYPGKASLEQRAAELCKGAKLQLPEARETLKQRNVFPTQEGWADGDRRVDCFIETTNGDTLTASLLP